MPLAWIAARWFLVFLFLAMLAPWSGAATATTVGSVDALVPRIEFLEDPEGGLSYADILQPAQDARFTLLDEGTQPNFGLSRSAYWLRLRFELADGAAAERFLEIAYPFLGSVELIAEGEHVVSGAKLPFSTRPIPHRNFVFPLALRTGTTNTYYLRVASEGTLTIPVRLWTPAAFHRAAQDAYLLLGLYYGEFLALMLYNLILFLTLRDRAYLAYVLFVMAMTATNLSYNGLGMQYVWAEWPTEGRVGLTVVLALSAVLSMLFSRIFLNTRRNAPRLDIALQAATGLFGVALAVAVFDLRTAFAIMAISGLVFPALCLAAGVVSLRNGHSSARYFLLGWSALLIGTILYTMRTLNLLPANFFTLNAIQIGTAVEMLLFSFALADRTRKLIDANAELRERQRYLHEVAHRDPLTGLGNRLLLEDRLQHAIEVAQRNGKPVAVMMVDLDDFKPVNDRYGHAVGDELLKVVASTLLDTVRASDTVTRLGGDEFVLIIETLASPDDAHRLAEKIRRQLARPITVDGHQLSIGASVGVALFPADTQRPEDLLRRADEAMYRAKEATHLQHGRRPRHATAEALPAD